MSENMLRDIEYLREKADITYEEAAALLEENGGDVVRALMALEQQGKLRDRDAQPQWRAQCHEEWHNDAREAKEKAKTVLQKALRSRVVIQRKREDGGEETVLNMGVPIVAGAAVMAPWLAVASAAAAVATGCRVKLEKDGGKAQNENC